MQYCKVKKIRKERTKKNTILKKQNTITKVIKEYIKFAVKIGSFFAR